MAVNTFDLWAEQRGILPFKPLQTGQVLLVNEPCFLPYECASCRLPERKDIAIGAQVIIAKSLEQGHNPLVQITDGALLYLNNQVYTGQFNLTSPELRLIYNGFGWQVPNFSATDTQNAARSGIANFTASGSFTVPAGVSEIVVDAKAADGGGGGGAYAAAYPSQPYAQSGTNGGSGAKVKGATIAVSAGDIIPITIGAHGGGGSAYGYWASSGGNFSFVRHGMDGGDAGITQVGELIRIEGGKRGRGGQGALDVPPSPIATGKAGTVLVNNTNGTAQDGEDGGGGKGGGAAQHRGGNAQSYSGSTGAAGYVSIQWEVNA
ncbi:hypothetical protein [Alteromonas sp. a30]|uniref:hypothetical protein n=1 Tax=Alteromonas sp. a30 TaxID=2730917 RepID=UPI00228237AD|nr:hypothetical protein [Alteromonas sp. a30]MCY7297489.1 hypothetical protein [Alteromonas sp. a30]